MATTEGVAEKIRAVADDVLWKLRTDNCQELVRFVRLRTERQRAAYGASDIEEAKNIFDPNALTLGFARRFATYKRPNLLLHDPERLARILTNQKYAVQLVLAGKAHPADQAGKDMIREWVHFLRLHDIRQHAVFLVDYDMLLAERIVAGVDVWINTPRRPWEASGTSGMKVLPNGGVNLSELDGWWAEAYQPDVGWAFGDGKEHGDDPAWDVAEAVVRHPGARGDRARVHSEVLLTGRSGVPPPRGFSWRAGAADRALAQCYYGALVQAQLRPRALRDYRRRP